MRVAPSPKKMRHVFAPAPSPIRRDELRMHALGVAIRTELLGEILAFLQRPAVDREPADWLALIGLSMAAFGAALDPDLNDKVLPQLGDVFKTDGPLAWVDQDTDTRLRRLVLDPISACLAFRCLVEGKAVAAARDVSRAENRILGRLIPSWSARGTAQRRSAFFAAITAVFRRHIPGVILSHALGQMPCAAVPVRTLVREAGHRLVAPAVETVTPSVENESEPPKNKVGKNPFEALKRALRAVLPSSAKGGEARGSLDERRKALDAQLARLVEEGLLPGLPGRLAANWLRDLIRHGPSLEELETSTLQTYASPVLEFLQSDIGKSFVTADPEAVEEAFRSQLHRAESASAQKRCCLVLRHFHEFAVRAIGLEPIEWSVVLDGLPELKSRVDANLIYWHELLLADELIANAAHVPADVRLLSRLYLRLMWATGLRFGECYRLRLMDILQNRSELYVRMTEHGGVKTPDGRRVVPLDHAFDRTGRALLKDAVERASQIGEGDRVTPLAGVLGAPRALVPRWQVASVLNEALRLATGDSSVRAHHLRHSRATRLVDAGIANSGRLDLGNTSDTMHHLLGAATPSRRTAHAIAQALGHSSPDVTDRTYVHHAEFRVNRLANSLLPKLSTKLIAALIGKPMAWVYKRATSTQSDLLENHLAVRTLAMPELDYRKDIDVTTSIPELPANVGGRLKSLSLLHVHYLQRIDARAELPAAVMASIMGTDHTAIQNSREALHTTALRLGYLRGAPRAESAWAGASIQYQHVMRAPAGFAKSKLLHLLEAVEPSSDLLHAARMFMSRVKRDASVLYTSNLDELSTVLDWLHVCGVLDSELGIRCPFTGGKEPVAVRTACSAFPKVEFVEKPMPKKRATGTEVHFFEGRSWTTAELAHVTFLWISRASTRTQAPSAI